MSTSVLVALNNARTEFHSLKITKTGHNKFAGYKYFELADFLIPALRIFSKFGLCAIVSFDENKATMTITHVEDGSSTVITSPMSSAALKGCHEVQNLGAVQTYLRRYLWVSALEIVEHDAIDSSDGKEIKQKTKAIKPTDGALDSSPAEERDYIKEMAAEFFESKYTPSTMVNMIENENLDNDQKVALWSLLPSHIRSAIKKEQDARKIS